MTAFPYSASLLQPEILRIAVLAAVLAILLLWQHFAPLRSDARLRGRLSANLMLAAVSAAAARLLVPFTTISAALYAQAHGIGLFNLVDLPGWVEFALALVAFDLAIYWQHRAFHASRLLWPLHRVHHSDIGFDCTLGLRFHPGEIMASLVYKAAFVLVAGPSVGAVVASEILLVGFSLFTHADVSMPARIERGLRRVFVTPAWHRVHHSVEEGEMNSNYSNILTLWDRLFATAIEQPAEGHSAMRIGLPGFRAPADQRLPDLLLQPFKSARGRASG